MVAALKNARRGSGLSSPSSKRIMKSIHDSGRLRSASTTGSYSDEVRP